MVQRRDFMLGLSAALATTIVGRTPLRALPLPPRAIPAPITIEISVNTKPFAEVVDQLIQRAMFDMLEVPCDLPPREELDARLLDLYQRHTVVRRIA
jgi:hypothetical protein